MTAKLEQDYHTPDFNTPVDNVANLSNADLIAAYRRSDDVPEYYDADALAAEISQRGLDI